MYIIYNNIIRVVHTLHVVIFMIKLIPYKNVYDGLMTMNIITTQIFPSNYYYVICTCTYTLHVCGIHVHNILYVRLYNYIQNNNNKFL